MDGTWGHVRFEPIRCGIASEKLGYKAVPTCITRDVRLDALRPLWDSVLYVMQIVRHKVFDSAVLLKSAVESTTGSIREDSPH